MQGRGEQTYSLDGPEAQSSFDLARRVMHALLRGEAQHLPHAVSKLCPFRGCDRSLGNYRQLKAITRLHS